MTSMEIFLDNINRIAKYQNLETYKDLAADIGVTETALKKWQNKTRCPLLSQIDKISDKKNIYSYTLLQENGYILKEIEFVKNDSRKILLDNLQKYFINNGKFSWSDKASVFYGFVSEDNLKSYFRKNNFKTPPLKRLDDMAEAIGIPVHQLIKKGLYDEKTN